MTRLACPLLLCLVLLAAPWSARTSDAGPPPEPRDLPGGWPDGKLRATWIAPYVRHVETWVGSVSSSRVAWYGRDGALRRDVEGLVNDGFVMVTGEGHATVYGTRAPWTVTLPDVPPGTQSYVHGAGTGTFVRDRWTDEGPMTADVYVDGEHAKTLGPFLRYRAETFHTNEDGSLAALVRPMPDTPTPRVVAFAPGGIPTFQAEFGAHALLIAVAPGGVGVLLQENEERVVTPGLSWVTKDGPREALDVGPNPFVLAWVHGTSRALVACSGAAPKVTYKLVDWAAGRVLWATEDPAATAAWRGPDNVAIEGGHVLLAGIECHVVDGAGSWLRSVYALDVATGKLEASWRTHYRGPPGYDAPRFVRTAGQLHLVSNEDFASFPLSDMTSLTNGWRSGAE